MAEETLHDSFSGATKGLFGTIGFLLLMFGGEVMLDRVEPRFILGAMLCLAGVMCFYMAFAGKVIRNRLSNYTIQEINSIARSPKWWFAALLAFVVSISLWHYAGPSFTKPEIIFADAVTKGWSYHDGMFEIDVRGAPLSNSRMIIA